MPFDDKPAKVGDELKRLSLGSLYFLLIAFLTANALRHSFHVQPPLGLDYEVMCKSRDN